MYRFLLTPRWLALHVVVLLVIPAFVFLGRWQFGRYESRSAAEDRNSTNLSAPPVPFETLTSVGGAVPEKDKYRRVTATGTYDAAHELLVRRRTQNTQVGFYVLTPLKTPGGAVLVNRGWVKAGATADSRPDVPPPPGGQVTLTGRLRPAETTETTGIIHREGLPEGQILLIDDRSLGGVVGSPLYGGYVDLIEQQPISENAPEPVPAPEAGGGGGLNLAYGVQWWLFIGVAIGGWILLIRRELHDRRQTTDNGGADEATSHAVT
ncbi:SURF1 family cytochrome oxidase biogenesis protein [Herbidospora cretacea]|uniref:SURF1 family cytochrome oxidase biogenesis protein n=1 Tax=Herbidospora cretacea TaxID=28444 RepID=UPI0009ED7FA6|nr:SURF1 family protein [Herbidospora cretacea]